MAKAKDLLSKDSADPKSLSEQDKVSAAYEDITNRLARLRGEADEEDDEDKKKVEESDDEENEEPDESEESKVKEEEEETPKKKEEPEDENDTNEIDPLDDEAEDLTPQDIEKENEKEAADLEQSGESDSFAVEPTDPTEENLGPRKTFEKSAPVDDETSAPRQFKTHNIIMGEDDESELPQRPVPTPSHDLDDLATEDETKPRPFPQDPTSPQYSDMPSQTNLRNPAFPSAESESMDIPPVGSSNPPKPRYNFYDPNPQPAGSGGFGNQPGGFVRSGSRTVSPFGTEYPRRGGGGSKSSIFQLIILLVIGAAVIGGTVYFLKNQFTPSFNLPFLNNSTPVPQASPVTTIPAVTPIPSPTPVPLDRSQFKIRVLNGTTKTGFAATVSASLKSLGYQTDKTANATNSAFQKTQVRIKPTATNLDLQLIQDLKDTSNLAATVSSNLKSSDTVDGEIILGLE